MIKKLGPADQLAVSPSVQSSDGIVPFLRSPYNYDMLIASDTHALVCPEPTMAKQSFKEECDINTIVERFGLAYVVPEGVDAPAYGDFSGVRDFASAMDAIAKARESFDVLPASVRARFQNDPAAFCDFATNNDNRAELEAMGLVVKKEAPPVVVVPPVADVPPKEA